MRIITLSKDWFLPGMDEILCPYARLPHSGAQQPSGNRQDRCIHNLIPGEWANDSHR